MSTIPYVKKTMDSILQSDTGKYIVQNKTTIIMVLAIVSLFLSISYFVYVNNIFPLINRDYVANQEFITSSTGKKDVVIYFFFTEWCPYCKKALPEWHNFKTLVESSPKYDLSYNIIFREVDCEKSSGLADRYKVEGYPTIKLLYNDDVYNYDAKPNKNNLLDFLDGSLDSKKQNWLGGLISF